MNSVARPHISNLRNRAAALGLSITKYEVDAAQGCTTYVVHKPNSDWQHGELNSLHGVASIIEQCEADPSQIPVLAYCVETTHFSAEVEPTTVEPAHTFIGVDYASGPDKTAHFHFAAPVDPLIAARINTENQIVRAVVEDAIAAGWTVGLHDGEDFAINRSTDADAIMALTHATDEEVLVLVGPGGDHANVWLVYGNDGWDVIADYTARAEPFLKRAAKIGWDAENYCGVASKAPLSFYAHPVCAFDESTPWIGSDEAALFLEAVLDSEQCLLVDDWNFDLQHAVAERLTILATGGLLSSL